MSEADDRKSEQILQARTRAGDHEALALLFARYRGRLERIVRHRLDARIAGRCSPSDVMQDLFLRARERMPHFQAASTQMSFWVWLRLLLSQQLTELARFHLLARQRDARREVTFRGDSSRANWPSSLATSITPSRILRASESVDELARGLSSLSSSDREVIALRHFEELSNQETARVLGIQPAAASKRYARAMRRLRQHLQTVEGTPAPPGKNKKPN